MGLFHKLAVGFKRFFGGKSLNYVSSEKLYGEEAEHDAYYFVKSFSKCINKIKYYS